MKLYKQLLLAYTVTLGAVMPTQGKELLKITLSVVGPKQQFKQQQGHWSLAAFVPELNHWRPGEILDYS